MNFDRKKIVKKIKEVKLFWRQLAEYGYDTKVVTQKHDVYLEALEDILGTETANELENEAINLISKKF